MPPKLSDAEKVQRITAHIRQEYYPAWTDQQSRNILTSAQSAVQMSDFYAFASPNGQVNIAINTEGLGAVVKINGVDVFGVNSGTTVIQSHSGSGQ